MITNGYLLDRCLDPVSHCVENLNVSFNAGTPETLSRPQDCGPGMFHHVVDAVKKVRGRGVAVGFSIVVNKQNFREIPELSRLWRELEVPLCLTPLGVYPETEFAMAMDAAEQVDLFDLLLELESRPNHMISNIP